MRNEIALLSQETIDKIAAGEVVERPSSVVKELVENAIDAGSDSITIEIKDGGISFIRISDNGIGIPKDQIRLAFLRHSTSKIKNAEDLNSITSLGFRGEALSSISAVACVEVLTKTQEDLTGYHYVVEGAVEQTFEEIGCPNGTSFLIRNLFFNTPVRKKFLKSPQTEANYIIELTERLALSHPEISFSLIVNGTQKLSTAGNGSLSDCIYQVYGREIAKNLLPISYEDDFFSVNGFLGKPPINRGNRSFEHFYVNGRYVKSKLISKAVEEGYVGFCMQHQYPFVILFFDFKDHAVDVNVHPTKMEVRFENPAILESRIRMMVQSRLLQREDISDVTIGSDAGENTDVNKKDVSIMPEPFESKRRQELKDRITASIHADTPYERQYPHYEQVNQTNRVQSEFSKSNASESFHSTAQVHEASVPQTEPMPQMDQATDISYEQATFLTEEAKPKHKIIGQLFETYWLIEFEDKLYIIDQHAAHEKVLFEQTMGRLKDKTMTSQSITPPVIITLNQMEEEALQQYYDVISSLGFQIENFGGREYAINGLPDNLFSVDPKTLLFELLDQTADIKSTDPQIIYEKVASMSCKAAVKGHDRLTQAEARALIDQLMELENPYHCPHGRPTIIAMSKQELEKKFKRIV